MAEDLLQLALNHHRAGRLAEAEAIYRQLLIANPNNPDALHLLGVVAAAAEQFDQAIDLYRRAIAILPDYSTAYLNLSIALQQRGRADEAMAAMRRSLELRPNDAVTLANFGNMLKDAGEMDQSIAAFRRAVAADPEYAPGWHNLIYAAPFCPGISPHDVLAEARLWAQRAETRTPARWEHPNDRSPDRKLRIGYVSPDFRGHVVGWNLLPLLHNHRRDEFEIFCYSAVSRPDSLTGTLRDNSDHWRDIYPLNDERAAELIFADAIDILVDLTSHMAGNRLALFARKPAPVQVTYLGCCGTTGLAAMDYRLSDPYLDPPGSDLSCYCEKTLNLPASFWCYEPGPAPPPVATPPSVARGAITFGSLNNFAKLSPAALQLWMEILRRAPGSRLLLHAPEGAARQKIRDRFSAAGLNPDRLEFVGMQPRLEYLRTFHRMDIALDPFPYGGGITTCDTLWMSVPVITLHGPTAVSRLGTSILSNIGLGALVAQTVEQYVALAVDLAGDAPRLAALHGDLRRQMSASPLMNARRFAVDVESAFGQMWRAWCETRVASDAAKKEGRR